MSRVTHGRAYTSEYAIWNSMLQRCTNPKNKEYARYGGRGITVCKAWLRFEPFFAAMGERFSPKHTLASSPNDIIGTVLSHNRSSRQADEI